LPSLWGIHPTWIFVEEISRPDEVGDFIGSDFYKDSAPTAPGCG
jgi:hypothetical protein